MAWQRLAASSMFMEMLVLLYVSTDWLDSMKPMPPMSAARLYTCALRGSEAWLVGGW